MFFCFFVILKFFGRYCLFCLMCRVILMWWNIFRVVLFSMDWKFGCFFICWWFWFVLKLVGFGCFGWFSWFCGWLWYIWFLLFFCVLLVIGFCFGLVFWFICVIILCWLLFIWYWLRWLWYLDWCCLVIMCWFVNFGMWWRKVLELCCCLFCWLL